MTQLNAAQLKVEEDRKFVLANEWMIRPCLIYDAEYSECKSLRSRFYQYYRDGTTTDCNGWYADFKDCKHYEKNVDFAAGRRLVQSEMKRLDDRIKAHEENDVWKQRQKRPPPNWEAPLPPHLEKKRSHSYLLGKEKKMSEAIELGSSRCVIS